jgi:hypothetical protein
MARSTSKGGDQPQHPNIEPHGLDIGARLQTICGVPGGDQWGGGCL